MKTKTALMFAFCVAAAALFTSVGAEDESVVAQLEKDVDAVPEERPDCVSSREQEVETFADVYANGSRVKKTKTKPKKNPSGRKAEVKGPVFWPEYQSFYPTRHGRDVQQTDGEGSSQIVLRKEWAARRLLTTRN